MKKKKATKPKAKLWGAAEMKTLRTYVVKAAVRGRVTYLVKNCKTAAEAREKIASFSDDVEACDTSINEIFHASASVRIDKPRR